QVVIDVTGQDILLNIKSLKINRNLTIK
ncbi:MAG: hypothetical protein ACJASN_000578, partial [Cyclobacteriaceae bacterium]